MYQMLFTQAEITSAVSSGGAALTKALPNQQGCSIQIENESKYGIGIYNAGQQIDYVKPNDNVIFPLKGYSQLSVTIDPSVVSTNTQGFAYIGYRVITGVQDYYKGSGTFAGAQSVSANITNANIPVSGEVNANISNANINTRSIDAYIADNPLVKLYTTTVNITNLTAGAAQQLFNVIIPEGLYDGIVFVVDSQQGIMSSYGYSYFDLFTTTNHGASYGYANASFTSSGLRNSGGGAGVQQIAFNSTYYGNSLTYQIKNVSASTIVSDVITVTAYGVQATVNILNPTSAPVYGQESVGTFDKSYFMNQLNPTGGTQYTIVSASVGGYVKQIKYAAINNTTATSMGVAVWNGSQMLYQVELGPYTSGNSSSIDVDVPLGDGIPNNGITVSCGAAAGQIIGYAIVNQIAGRPVPATLQ